VFLAPSLTRLRLSLDDTNATRSWLLPSLRCLCPNITNLTLETGFAFDSDPAISDCVCGWSGLKSLKAPLLTNHAITHLSTLASLRSLTFELDEDFHTKPGALQSLPFTSLQDLSIHSQRAGTLLSFISCIRPNRITHVSLNLVGGDEDLIQDLRGLVLTLQQCMPHTSLTNVELEEEWRGGHANAIPGDIIYPLFSFTNLKVLEFGPGCPFAPDDALIRDIAKAFPQLQILHLGSSYGSGGRTNVTLPGLVPLVQYCPELWSLGIVVDTSNIDLLSDRKPGHGFSNRKIRSLDLGDSRISKPAKVASFLSDIFPRLRIIDTDYHFDERSTAHEKELYEKLWKEVADLIEHFAEARRQERSWYGGSDDSESSTTESESE
jgi:hypothetical protein